MSNKRRYVGILKVTDSLSKAKCYIAFDDITGIGKDYVRKGRALVHLLNGDTLAVDESYHHVASLFYADDSDPTPLIN